MVVKVAYINFWKDSWNDRYFSKFIKENIAHEVIEVHYSKNPDILIASTFGNIHTIKNINAKCKMFYYGENLYRYPPYNDETLLYDTFDLIVGFKEDGNKMIRFPLWMVYYNFYNMKSVNNTLITYLESKHAQNKYIPKDIFCCIIARHDRGGQRTLLWNEMKTYGNIESPGAFCNNTNKIGTSVQDKISYMTRSVYNICPENSIYEGYTTEKIFQALEAGSIPIYWGWDPPEKGLLNQNKYCFYKGTDNIKDVIENKEKYLQGPIFTEDAHEILHGYYTNLSERIKQLTGFNN